MTEYAIGIRWSFWASAITACLAGEWRRVSQERWALRGIAAADLVQSFMGEKNRLMCLSSHKYIPSQDSLENRKSKPRPAFNPVPACFSHLGRSRTYRKRQLYYLGRLCNFSKSSQDLCRIVRR